MKCPAAEDKGVRSSYHGERIHWLAADPGGRGRSAGVVGRSAQLRRARLVYIITAVV